MNEIAAAKQALRRVALSRRGPRDPADANALAEHVLQNCGPPPGSVVSGFWPLGDEIDLRPLLEILHARGHTIVLPKTPPPGNPLTFRVWRPGCAMLREKFGTLCPEGAERRPDWLFVPLLAFDRAGRRLGYGGGYYDRTLAGLPEAVAIGCAYADQEVSEVPADIFDIRLRAVATERGIVWCGSAKD